MPDPPNPNPGASDPEPTVSVPSSIAWSPLARLPAMRSARACGEAPDVLSPSIAISVAQEPVHPDDCTITSYVKLTASITGEVNPVEQPESVGATSEYWGCYAATLRVAVHAGAEGKAHGAAIPVITDFEPKLRDLFEAGTVQSSLVSGSSSQVTVDRNAKSTLSTTLGLSGTVSYNGGGGSRGGGGGGPGLGASVTGSIQSVNGQEIDFTQGGTQTGTKSASAGATTSISQLYNLATGYHAGTNSIALVLQPRPHVEQSPFGPLGDFTPGLRAIEGIQEVVLVVSRPNDEANAALRVTAWMDLVHIGPLSAEPPTPSPTASRLLPDPERGAPAGTPLLLRFDTEAARHALDADPARPPRDVPGDVAQYVQFFDLARMRTREGTPVLPPGTVIDTDAGDGPDHPGVTLWASYTSRHDQDRIALEEYGAIGPTTVRVAYTQTAAQRSEEGVLSAAKSYAVWVRPLVPDAPRPRVSGDLHRRQWKLCAAYRVDPDTGCPKLVPDAGARPPPNGAGRLISDERIAVSPDSLDAAGAASIGSLLNQRIHSLLSG